MSNPPPCRPGQLAVEQCRLAAPVGASRKDLVVLFRTRVLQLFQVIVGFFFPGIYPKASPEAGGSQHTPGTSIALPSNRGDAPTELQHHSPHALRLLRW